MGKSSEFKVRNSVDGFSTTWEIPPQRPPYHRTTWTRRQGTPNMQYTQPAVKVSVSRLILQCYLLRLTNIASIPGRISSEREAPPQFPSASPPSADTYSRQNLNLQQVMTMTIAIPYTGQYPTTISRLWNFWSHVRTLILTSRSVCYGLWIATHVLKEGLGWVGLDTIDDGMQHRGGRSDRGSTFE